MVLSLIAIQFSFSDVFGDNIWYCIFGLKLIGVLMEHIIEKSLHELLLVSPLSITYNVIVGLVTFGADDFLDFIEAYFYEFGIMFFERMYLGPIMDAVFEIVETDIPAQFKKWYQWLTNDTDEENFTGGNVNNTSNLFNKDGPKDSDDSGSTVRFSDEDSFRDENISVSQIGGQELIYDAGGLENNMYKQSSSESGHGDGEKGELENSGTSEDITESSNQSDDAT